MSTTEFSPALSRRRILQGAAWATPAILIATAAPAAAASPPVLGGINLVSVSGIQDSSVLTVAATTTYQGEGPPSPDHPVTGVTVTVAVPTARVVNATGTPSTTSAGWVYTSSLTEGLITTYTFTWNGTGLGHDNTASSLVALIPKNNLLTDFDITVQGHGVSNSQIVHSAPAVRTVGAFAVMTFNNGPSGHGDGAGANPRYMFIQGAILNEVGHPNFNVAPVVNVEATVRVPTAEVGPGTPRAEPYTPWTYAATTTSGADTVYRFTLNANGGTLPTTSSPTQFVFVIPRRSAGTTPVTYTVTFSGKSPDAASAVSTLVGTIAL